MVATYNALGARVFLVPASYDNQLNSSLDQADLKAMQGKDRITRQPASREGMDWAFQDALDEYDASADSELVKEGAGSQAVAGAGAAGSRNIDKAGSQSTDRKAAAAAAT